MLPLIESLKTPCIATQVWAARMLVRMGPAAAAAIPALKKLRRASSPAVRKAAAQSIRRIEAKMPPPQPGLFSRLTVAIRDALGAIHS
jgi:hypothetical protein